MLVKAVDIETGFQLNKGNSSAGGAFKLRLDGIPILDVRKWLVNPENNRCYNLACDIHTNEILEPGDLGQFVEGLELPKSVELCSDVSSVPDESHQAYLWDLSEKLRKDSHRCFGNEEHLCDGGNPLMAVFAIKAVDSRISRDAGDADFLDTFHFYCIRKNAEGVAVWAQKAGEQRPSVVSNIFEDVGRQGYAYFLGFWQVDQGNMQTLKEADIYL